MEAAALHEYPVLQHPTAKASVPQRSGLPAPCVPCPRAGGVLHLPFTHTQPWLQKPSLPERYTSLLPAEKTAAGILQSAHAAARNSHSSTWLQEQRRPARLPRCHGSQPSQSGWGPRHPARACGSRHPLCTCAAPGCCCPGALPGGCWPGGCELLRLSLMVHLSKLTPAHVGPAPGRPNVRRAPSAAARAVPWRRCAAPRGKLGRKAPTLAGRRRTALCWRSWAVLGVGPPLCSPLPRSPGPSTVFLAGVSCSVGSPNHSFALKAVGWVLSSQVWTGVFQALLFRCSAFSPAISSLYLHFPLPISSTNMKLSRSRSEGEDVGVAPWKGFSALT